MKICYLFIIFIVFNGCVNGQENKKNIDVNPQTSDKSIISPLNKISFALSNPTNDFFSYKHILKCEALSKKDCEMLMQDTNILCIRTYTGHTKYQDSIYYYNNVLKEVKIEDTKKIITNTSGKDDSSLYHRNYYVVSAIIDKKFYPFVAFKENLIYDIKHQQWLIEEVYYNFPKLNLIENTLDKKNYVTLYELLKTNNYNPSIFLKN